MGLRREGREAAIQLLFAQDLHPGEKSAQERAAFWELHQGSEKVRALADQLADGVLSKLQEVDKHLNAALHNFTSEKLADVDRNILRLAVYELLATDVPVPVVINEAVEIAKKFSTTQSGKFVNGIIDRLGKQIRKDRPDPPKPAKQPKKES
jgi:transcription antitermination protein NusB